MSYLTHLAGVPLAGPFEMVSDPSKTGLQVALVGHFVHVTVAETIDNQPVATMFDWPARLNLITVEATARPHNHAWFVAVDPDTGEDVAVGHGYDLRVAETAAWWDFHRRLERPLPTRGDVMVDADICPDCGGNPRIALSPEYAGYGICTRCNWSELGPGSTDSKYVLQLPWPPDSVAIVADRPDWGPEERFEVFVLITGGDGEEFLGRGSSWREAEGRAFDAHLASIIEETIESDDPSGLDESMKTMTMTAQAR